MANVNLENVGKNYGTVNVLKAINLEITDGEFVVLIGPSGCGKSTLLRMIAGLETITEGEMRLDGDLINEREARDRDIAMVFQSYALYPHMNVARNIGFPLKIRKEDAATIDRRVQEVAELTGLSELLDRKPAALSGGQRQRVAMGRAIIRNPRLFLFDEPLSNLDAKLRVQMRLQIRDLHRKVGATSIYVTHDQVEAMTLADRIVLLHDGNIQQVGSPLELYERPANAFVAGFIGSPEMNFLNGKIAGTKAAPEFRSGTDVQVTLPNTLAKSVQMDQDVILGIRPEHLHPGKTGIVAKVRDSELLGSETHIFAEAENTLLTSVISGSNKPIAGTELLLEPDLSHLHLFDANSKLRIGA
ncbi:MAG: ABC transporter ATP-binding protein [Alphaproteobacteria bacterium]